MTKGTRSESTALAGSPGQDGRPKVRVSFAGVDGNALSLIGAWRKAARGQGWREADIGAVSEEALSADYGHVLRTLLANSEPPDEDDAE